MIRHRITSLKATFFLLACLLLLPACTTEPARKTPEASPDATARAYLDADDHAAAAREFMRLAETGPAEQALSYRLQAAAAWLDANEPDRSADILSQLRISPDEEQLLLQQNLLRARLALYRNKPEQALSLLPAVIPADSANTVHADYHEIRARIFEIEDDYTGAVRERNHLQQYLESGKARRRNNEKLWESLRRLGPEELEPLSREGSTRLTGWVELADIFRQLLSRPDQLETAVEEWRRMYTGHPAIPAITTRIVTTSRELRRRPGSIALLLPFSGPYKRASEAVRDGFLAAWYAEEDYRPTIRVYDTDALSITDNYRQAVEDGAEFIVGPLEKSAIRTLLENADISLTTLALNQIDTDDSGVEEESGPLYQFALAPEHEIRQVAHRGILEGFNRVLVITPDNQWGERMSSTFIREWESLGGNPLESVSYTPGSRDFISPVQKLLNIDSSEQRIRRLRQRLGRNITATNRTRKDAEFIYLGAIPAAARQIVPQFRFFGVDETPIYSTSHIFSGLADPQLDADMNGIEFTDIPWVLRRENEYTPLQKLVSDSWLSQNSSYTRLYAFGVDAFRLIPQMREMSLVSRYRYNGETGELSLSNNNSIQRRLQWAKFIGGRPVPLDIGNRFETAPEYPPQR
ncbi:MAG: penicillin-binding protein activator [Gammaproteobacteria bacterium]